MQVDFDPERLGSQAIPPRRCSTPPVSRAADVRRRGCEGVVTDRFGRTGGDSGNLPDAARDAVAADI